MISHKHRCIFIHLRRTGGNSIEAALGGITLLNENGQVTDRWVNKLHRGNKTSYKLDNRGTGIHATAIETRKQYPDEWNTYFKFSIVRNPWAQMFSIYRRVRNKETPSREGFDDFLGAVTTKAATVPSLSLRDRKGRWLMDYIGRFESLNDDFNHVCQQIGAPDVRLPVHNSSDATSYVDFYTPVAKRCVDELYATDIEYFGYRFGE